MSLNQHEREATARELAENLARSGRSAEEIRAQTGLSEDRFRAALTVSEDVHPADTWLVRDTIVAAVREAGNEPAPFSKLTDDMRQAAAIWFGYEGPAAG